MSDSTGSWQPDPNGRHQYRYWDGSQWTDQVADDGVTSVDPPDPGSTPPAGAVAAPADAAAPAEPAVPTPTEPIAPTPAEPVPTEPTASTWGTPPTDPGATTAMPVAGGEPPAGGVPPLGTPPPSEPPKKGSNTPALIIGGVLLLVLIGAAAFLIFGGDDDDDARDELISSMVDEGTSRQEAECLVDFMADEIGMDRLQELDGDAEPTAEETSIAVAAAFECSAGSAGGDLDDSDDNGGLAGGIAGNQALMDLFIQGVMSGSDLTEQQARCFSEEFLENSGVDLEEMMEDPDSMATNPQVMSAILQIFATCDIDLDAMGGGGTSGFGSGDSYGDDPELDALWDACEDGDGEACDDLYFQSPLGSEYEEFGDTCGGRFEAGTVLCVNEDLS